MSSFSLLEYRSKVILKLRAKMVIVGSGIVGLTTAYNLAKLGENDVIVVEQKYLAYGSSTRNAGHFRVHFWAPENTRFAIEARKRLLDFASKIRWNAEIDLGGYLWLLYKEEHVKAYERSNREIWSKFGVSGKILTPEEISELFPYVNLEGVIAGFYGPQDGKINPHAVIFGYYEEARKMGVNFLPYTRVEKIIVDNNKVRGVQTNKGIIESEKVLVAAGGWSTKLLKNIGIDLPIEVERKEIGVTEPINYFIKPFIVSLKSGVYVGQMVRGEVLGSIDYPIVKGLTPFNTTLDWIHKWSENAVEVVPQIKHLMFLRTWSGYYVVTPDHSHILGRDPEWPENLYVATGFSGHGFMMAPFAGEVMAKNLLYDEIDELMKPYLPTRFKEEKLIHETMVIG